MYFQKFIMYKYMKLHYVRWLETLNMQNPTYSKFSQFCK